MEPSETNRRIGALADTEPELYRYLRVVRDRWWVIVLALVLGAAQFINWASKQTRTFLANATIVVDATPPQILGGEVRDVVQVGPGQYWQMQDYIQTQRRVLTSDTLARRVIQRLKLDGDHTFWGQELPPTPEEADSWFVGGVGADPIPDTQLLSVSFTHVDPLQAKRAVDGLVDTYIESNGAWRDSSNANASTWLATEADDLRKRLSASELELYEFKRKSDLLSVSLEERVNNVSRQIEKLSDALTEVRLRRVSRSSEAQELAKMGAANPDSISPVSGSGTLEALKTQVLEEERKLSELKARYEDPHPLVRQQAAKVQSARDGLRGETARLVRGAEARTNEATDQEKKIAAQLEQAKQEGMRVTRLEIDYNKIKRETEALSKQYQMVQNRTKETQLASRVKANNLHVLDYARVPATPTGPHLFRSGVTTFLLALMLGIAFALLLDALDRSVKTQEDVENKLQLPFLGLMPRLAAAERSDTYVADQPSSVVAEACRAIRTNLMFAGLKRPLRRILVTSSMAREGKTFTTISLGVVMAQAGNKVLLIDSDLRSPRLRSALGMARDVGLTDVLLGNATLDEAIQPTGIPNLSVLLSGGRPPNPAEVIDGPRFRETLDECADRYDRVLLDSPPTLAVTDPAILAGYCDGVVLVVRSRQTSLTHARRMRQVMVDLGAQILGVVLNSVDLARQGYGYGYGYGYGQAYGAQPPAKTGGQPAATAGAPPATPKRRVRS